MLRIILIEMGQYADIYINLTLSNFSIFCINQIEIDTGVAGSVKVGSGRRMSLDGDVHIWDSTALPELS